MANVLIANRFGNGGSTFNAPGRGAPPSGAVRGSSGSVAGGGGGGVFAERQVPPPMQSAGSRIPSTGGSNIMETYGQGDMMASSRGGFGVPVNSAAGGMMSTNASILRSPSRQSADFSLNDMSEFPTLPGASGPRGGMMHGSGQKEFSIAKEDFPVLGSPKLDRRSANTFQNAAATTVASSSGTGSAAGRTAEGDATESYGLMGLLDVIRMKDPDVSTLAIGIDLTTLGLNLNSPENLYSSIYSPFSDAVPRRDPEFTLPQCYHVEGLQEADKKLQLFSDETLFFVFYSLPRDAMQLAAAEELLKRGWKYHKDVQQWFIPSESLPSSQFEHGTVNVFDPVRWERVVKQVGNGLNGAPASTSTKRLMV